MRRRLSGKRKTLIAVICTIAGLIAAFWAITAFVYDAFIDQRFESDPAKWLYVEDFGGLSRTKYGFASDKGQMLTGYMYSACEDPCGIIVFAHGFGGGGHNSYMPVINYLAHNGFLVFAYDATGNDESGGDGVGGFPQGVIDLDHAITFVEESGNFPELPVGLLGHSWGGYSVSNVLAYHPEIKAVIECSGANSSMDLLESGGYNVVGPLIYAMRPFAAVHERIRYGEYSSNTAVDGFESADARIMVVHSADDDTVRIRYGYDKFYEKFSDDPRFTFIRFEDRGHNGIFNDPSNTYTKEFNAEFASWKDTLDYDCDAKENAERFKADRIEYVRTHLDRERYVYRLDTELAGAFVKFYKESFAE